MSVGQIVLRSTDPGAPALSGTNGSLVAVLDWALAQKGWTTIATATNQRIYKQAAGNGYGLYVAHDSTVSGAANYATARGCEATSTLASLVNPFPSVAIAANAVQRIAASTAASAAVRAYKIRLTDRYVHMAVDVAGTNANWQTWHFGDGYGAQAGDAYATFISVNGTSTGVDIANALGGSPPYVAFARDITGTVISTIGALKLPTTTGSTAMGSNPRYVAARAGYMNRLVREKVSYDDSGSANLTYIVGATGLPSRCWVPNLWNPLHNGWGSLLNGDTFADSAYNPSASFSMYGYASTGFAFHEDTDTWSPPSG